MISIQLDRRVDTKAKKTFPFCTLERNDNNCTILVIFFDANDQLVLFCFYWKIMLLFTLTCLL